MSRSRLRILGLLLVLGTVAAYWPVLSNDFIHYDDPEYVLENELVQQGVSREGLKWAFTTFHAANWHPLTWVSHMLDCRLFGPNPAGHHAVSLLLHVANSLLLFLLLREATGRLGGSFLVAALFALHPMHVESVAWVSERKDVLSTFFGFLALLAWGRYAGRQRAGLYLLSLAFFSLGLLSKPMLVTLPFVLLLWDVWPLARWRRSGSEGPGRPAGMGRLIAEKVPFLVLSAASCVVTIRAQAAQFAIAPLYDLPLSERALNAVLAYAGYLLKLIWPTDMAVFYPRGGPPDPLAGLLPALLLAGVTGLAVQQLRRRPHLAVGWFWFLGTLVPVIGLVQVGAQAMADRYTYLPYVGLFIAAVWSFQEACGRLRVPPRVQRLLWAASLTLLAAGTWSQLGHWKNTLTLFQHAGEKTRDNYLAHFMIGRVLTEHGDAAAGDRYYRKAVELNPRYVARVHNHTGYRLAGIGDLAAAEGFFRKALAVFPRLRPRPQQPGCDPGQAGKTGRGGKPL